MSAACAFWRRLDTPGHDSALLRRDTGGWTLCGCAVFLHEAGPAAISYMVAVNEAWETLRGAAEGFVAERAYRHIITREADGWRLDGVLVPGLEQLKDLDYGFTPATNLLQLRRAALTPGEMIALPVVWFDIDENSLSILPQYYERLNETSYQYRAPSVPYEARLDLSSDGFAESYPQLWLREN